MRDPVDRPTDASAVLRVRVVPVVLAAVGAVLSIYLGAYQMGWIDRVWDPVFGPASSSAVLHSVLERILPVPDALLGAGAYLGELALGLAVIVVTHRLVHVAYVALATAMAVVSTGLVAMQALVVHHFCALCLMSAIVSWLVALLVVPEQLRIVLAQRDPARRAGTSLPTPV
jgi:uncharacterized membrane protein